MVGRNLFHRGSSGGSIVWSLVTRFSPFGSTILVASVVREEGADARRSKVSWAESPRRRHHDGISEDDAITVEAPLQVAQDGLSVGHMVRKVREGLHDTWPRQRVVGPPGVGVELLIVLDEWLLQDLLSGPLGSRVLFKCPHLWTIDLDHFVYQTAGIPLRDEADSLLHRGNVRVEEMTLHDASRLKPFAHALLSSPGALGVASPRHPTECTLREGVAQSLSCECRLAGVVLPRGAGRVERAAVVQATSASGDTGPLGPLRLAVAVLAQPAIAIRAASRRHGEGFMERDTFCDSDDQDLLKVILSSVFVSRSDK